MPRDIDFAKKALHGGVLAFTAFWLTATSAVPSPASDCFEGIPGRTRIRVVLGDAVRPGTGDGGAASSDGGAPLPHAGRATPGSTAPSCAGLDGLAAGVTLTLDVDHGTRPDTVGTACWGYEVTQFSGATFVQEIENATSLPEGFAGVSGRFESLLPDEKGCRGNWLLEVHPVESPGREQKLNPFEAGTTHEWLVTRSISLAQAQFCPSTGGNGAITCSDGAPLLPPATTTSRSESR